MPLVVGHTASKVAVIGAADDGNVVLVTESGTHVGVDRSQRWRSPHVSGRVRPGHTTTKYRRGSFLTWRLRGARARPQNLIGVMPA